ncbi:myoneurin isoform X2 [Pyxicephalus adspersus]|uniref:myoneurin isoform X2 n=1 Tax=Pyxicephalus adspersus TaxID=30357 RepID=UPI003B5C8229
MAQSDHCKQLLDKLNKQRESGFLCDSTILIDDVQYKAHSNVLASFSEYFRALFHKTLDSTILLDRKVVTPAGFQAVLDFIYSGNLNFNRCNIEEICRGAEFLRVDEVVSICIPIIDSTMVVTACVTEIPLAKDIREDGSVSQSHRTSNTDKTEAICLAKKAANKKSLRSKKWKRTMVPHKKCLKKVSEQQNPDASPVLSINASQMDESLAELPSQDNCTLSFTTSLNCENLLKEDSMAQSMFVKDKYIKSKQTATLKEHWMSTITGGDIVCKIEDMAKDKISKNKPTCSICRKVFSEGSSLRRHMRIHKGVKPYVCHLCGKAFTQCNQLKTHVRTHTGEKPYICGVCGKSFISSGELNKHFRSHTGERPFVCEVCGNSYTDVKNLKKHKLKMHCGNEEGGESQSVESTVGKEAKKSPVLDSLDLKSSELLLPLTLHIIPDDHQMLLPVTDNQSLSPETLLGTSVTTYTEPQFIFLQQMN